MNILFITAIPELQSFGGKLIEQAGKDLIARGYKIETSNLYQSEFPAITYAEDFQIRANPDFFDLQSEQQLSFFKGCLPEAVKAEQDKVKDADVVIFIAPIYWSSPPAILRGWFEQVLTPGFAYDENHIFENGLLNGKSTFFVMTHTGKLGAATDLGTQLKVDEILRRLHERPLQYSGFRTLKPFNINPPHYQDSNARNVAIEHAVQEIIKRVESAIEEPKEQYSQYYPLIHINGRPGVGKKTIGETLASKINARFIDNHTLLNVGAATCGRATEGYYTVNRAVRDVVYESLREELKYRPVILTNTLTDQVEEHRDTYAEVELLSRKARAPFVPIILTADFNENVKRVQSFGRDQSMKITDSNQLKEMYKDFTIIKGKDSFEIDTTKLTPEESAIAIVKFLPNRQGYII